MANRVKNKGKSSNKEISDSVSPAKDLRFLKFRELYFELKQEYGKNFDKFFSLDEGYLIPCSIFNKQLSSFESIVKYLVENCGLKIAFISKIFNRTNKTIWQAYRSSKEKLPKKFTDLSSKFWIPASLFSDRKLSVLEHITIYLKTSYSMSFKEIAKILLRDITTVRTVYYRGRKKGGNK